MKNYILGFASLLLFTIACDDVGDKISKLTQFTINKTETVEIPAVALSGLDENIYSEEITVNLNDQIVDLINQEGVDTSLVEKIFISALDLTITSPDSSDFSFLVNAEFFVSSENIDEVRLAFVDEIPANIGNFLDIGVDNTVDLIPFLNENNLTLRMNAEITDGLIVDDYVIDVHGEFVIDAVILGQ